MQEHERHAVDSLHCSSTSTGGHNRRQEGRKPRRTSCDQRMQRTCHAPHFTVHCSVELDRVRRATRKEEHRKEHTVAEHGQRRVSWVAVASPRLAEEDSGAREPGSPAGSAYVIKLGLDNDNAGATAHPPPKARAWTQGGTQQGRVPAESMRTADTAAASKRFSSGGHNTQHAAWRRAR